MYFYSYYYILLPAIILAMVASFRVNSTFNKYSKVPLRCGMTGKDAALWVLHSHGIYNVSVEKVAGNLTDHFDPKANVIRLSQGVYDSSSTAAVGVAAHEAGHAVQHAEKYAPIVIREKIIPITNLGSNLALPLVLFGVLLSFQTLADIGCIIYLAVVAFQLVTLFAEFNASGRAIKALSNSGKFDQKELNGSRAVLRAAAMTYVAALFTALMSLVRLLAISGRGRRN